MELFLLSALASVGALCVREKQRKWKRIPSQLLGKGYDKELTVMVELALQAGDNILKALEQEIVIDRKGQVDFVTITDKNNELMIFRGLQSNFPEASFIGEEETSEAKAGKPILRDGKVFICDPVDGTTNFVHKLPMTCVSIGLVHNRVPVVGVVYSPCADELFLAIKGHGAFMNERRLNVSGARAINEAMMLTEVGYVRSEVGVSRMMRAAQALILQGAHAFRMLGSGVLNLCFIAAGRLDGAYCGVGGEQWFPWDYAAGSVIVTEAGGSMSTLEGAPFDIMGDSMVAASSKSLQEEIVHVVGNALLELEKEQRLLANNK